MVAEQLQQRKVDVLVPKLTDRDDSNLPYWDQHTEAVKQALADIPQERRVVLVGHSGEGHFRKKIPFLLLGLIEDQCAFLSKFYQIQSLANAPYFEPKRDHGTLRSNLA